MSSSTNIKLVENFESEAQVEAESGLYGIYRISGVTCSLSEFSWELCDSLFLWHLLCPFPNFFFIFSLSNLPTYLILPIRYFKIFIITHLFISVVVCVNLTETSIYLFFILDDISS